jgi:hypothetical protein
MSATKITLPVQPVVSIEDRGSATSDTYAERYLMTLGNYRLGHREFKGRVVNTPGEFVPAVELAMSWEALTRTAAALNDLIERTCEACGDTHETSSRMVIHQDERLCSSCLEVRLDEEASGLDPFAPDTKAEAAEMLGMNP